MPGGKASGPKESPVKVPAGKAILEGDLVRPDSAGGLVVFAHGSGSSRKSPRNRFVAQSLQQAGLGTLLFDLLTAAEEAEDLRQGNTGLIFLSWQRD